MWMALIRILVLVLWDSRVNFARTILTIVAKVFVVLEGVVPTPERTAISAFVPTVMLVVVSTTLALLTPTMIAG